MTTLYANVNGISDIDTISINESHGSSVSTAVISSINCSLEIGDHIEVKIGFSQDSLVTIFSGYVKTIERKIPDGMYTISASDVLIRAVDYFVVSTNPDYPFSRTNILVEDLVRDVLSLANLENYDAQGTNFVLAVNGSVAEVNLTSAYDYCKMVGEYVTWHLWATPDGVVHFRNRKPFPMTGNSSQPGDTTDEVNMTPSITLHNTTSNSDILDFTYKKSEQNLRNRVVVYGAGSISAEAKAESPYLPNLTGKPFYKTSVIASSILSTNDLAQKTADYNLYLYNRLSYFVNLTIQGNPNIHARNIIGLDEPVLGQTGNWYAYSVNHSITKEGYTTTLELRR
jgi:hypothetical protein